MSGIAIVPSDLSRVFTYTGKTIPGVNSAPTPGICYEDDEGRKFKYMLNGHSAVQTAGNFATYDFNGAGLTLAAGPLLAISGNTCIAFRPSTATLQLMAGVWMGAAPLSSSVQTGGGWVQYEGVCDPSTSVPAVGGIQLPGGLVEGTTDVLIGDILKPVDAQFYAVKDVVGGTTLPAFTNYAVALVGQTSATPALLKILLCCGQIK